ncbi:hypothetical protein [Longispora albida]|uniref:hypothetical protein n=1 Tax=Longispora albida TaxID=203523 RepID=UPI000360E933|nr:hypothetical protein [Longispora albida]
MFCEAGYRQRASERDLTWAVPAAGVEFFYLRPRDIATYVGSGAAQVTRRLHGVLAAREYVMLSYDVRAATSTRPAR